jgi:hypothetical protein
MRRSAKPYIAALSNTQRCRLRISSDLQFSKTLRDVQVGFEKLTEPMYPLERSESLPCTSSHLDSLSAALGIFSERIFGRRRHRIRRVFDNVSRAWQLTP